MSVTTNETKREQTEPTKRTVVIPLIDVLYARRLYRAVYGRNCEYSCTNTLQHSNECNEAFHTQLLQWRYEHKLCHNPMCKATPEATFTGSDMAQRMLHQHGQAQLNWHVCPSCQLVFYCSNACRILDATLAGHSKRCTDAHATTIDWWQPTFAVASVSKPL